MNIQLLQLHHAYKKHAPVALGNIEPGQVLAYCPCGLFYVGIDENKREFLFNWVQRKQSEILALIRTCSPAIQADYLLYQAAYFSYMTVVASLPKDTWGGDYQQDGVFYAWIHSPTGPLCVPGARFTPVNEVMAGLPAAVAAVD